MVRRRKILVALVLVTGFAGGWWCHDQQPLAHSGVGTEEKALPAVPADDGKLRIIAFGAHPDDCELKAGGVAAKWAAQGHHVKFVSVTNGDIGHWQIAGGPLAKRRLEEVQKAARILGIHTQVLDIHDGELEPTLEHRRTITRLIRQWKADIVLAHRPNDYHPDHRYTGILVQDAAYMVTVPFFCPDVPYLQKNPVFLYYSDRFERPNPFRADLVVDIDDVSEKKLAALDVLESQFFEGGCNGGPHLVPKDAAGREERRRQVRQGFADRSLGLAKKYRAKLVELYGKERGGKVQQAEAFELCEYGSQPNLGELRKLFPFFGETIKKSAGWFTSPPLAASRSQPDSPNDFPSAKPQAADLVAFIAQDDKPGLDKAALAWTLPWDVDWVTAVTFVGPTRRLAAGNKLGQILIWDLPENVGEPLPAPVRRLDGHANQVTALAATPDGRWLISSSYDHTVRLWDMRAPAKGTSTVVLKGAGKKKGKQSETGTDLKVDFQEADKVLTAHQEWVRGLSLSKDGKQLLSGDDKGVAILWQLPEGKELRRMQVKGWLQAVALSPDAGLAATCEYAPRYSQFPNALRVWDATTGKDKLDLGKQFARGSGGGVIGMTAASFALDSKLLALGQGGEVEGGNGKIFLVSAADGKKLRDMNGHLNGITSLVFHPDGRHLASTGRDTVVRLWQISDGKMVAELGKVRGGQFRDWIHGVAFSADGKWLAAADMAGQIHVWSFVAGKQPTKS